jgi:hypothetical protein
MDSPIPMNAAVGQFELDGTPPLLRDFVDFDNAVSAGPALAGAVFLGSCVL